MAKRRARGEGSIYKRKSGGRAGEWVGQLTVGAASDGRRRVKTVYGQTQAECRAKLDSLRHASGSGTLAEPGALTVADLVSRFLASKARSVRETTLGLYRHSLHRHVLPRIGGVRLSRLATVHVSDWLAELDRDSVGLRAKQHAFDDLRRCLDFGVKLKLLGKNPASALDRPQVLKPEIQSLTKEQAQKLLQTAQDTCPAWVTAAVSLGLCALRRGEIFGLAWRDVDLEAGTVRVRQQATETAQGVQGLSEPKTKNARRQIPIPPFVIAALRKHRAELGIVPHGERLVFLTAEGTQVRFSNFNRRQFKPLVERAEIPTTTLHSLRHTAATLLLGSGADLKTAQQILGHARAAHTLDIYASFVPGNAEDAMGKLGALIGL